jgi:site-specific recombinase XerD
MNLNEALNQFVLASKANGLRDTTIKWYESIVLQMIATLGNVPIDSVTPTQMREYIVSLREKKSRYANATNKPEQKGALSDNTIASHLRAYHRFWAWVSEEYDVTNPMKNVKRPKQSKPLPKAISAEDFIKLFNATERSRAGFRDKALLVMLADTGARLGGVIKMKVEDIDFIHRRAVVTEKGNIQRLVYFTPFTSRLTMHWLNMRQMNSTHVFTNLKTGEPLTVSGVHQMLKRLSSGMGITGRINPHSFRHAFAREYIKNGGDVVTLAQLLGHQDVKVTADYYAIFDDSELRTFHDQHTPMRKLEETIHEDSL